MEKKLKISKIKIYILLLLLLTFSIIKNSYAQSLTIIRDSEIEMFIKEISSPIFEAADLDPNAINIYIIQDQSLNAFISNGQNLFINSGTITDAKNYNELVGVISHETGHIMGGHLIRSQEKLENLQQTTLISAIIAGAAAVASGRGEVGAAIATGANTSSIGSYMSYRKNEERAADKSATNLLKETNQSAKGLLSFMKKIKQQEFFINSSNSEYFRTHPLTRERITYIEDIVKNEKNIKNDTELEKRFKNIQAKLFAYIEPTDKTLLKYKTTNNSDEAIYARSIAYMKNIDLKKSINEINYLIKKDETNPFYHELKAQIYYENGNTKEAKKEYEKAHNLLPNSELIKMSYSQTLISNENNFTDNEKAIKLVNSILIENPKNINAWRILSVAYNNTGNQIAAKYAAAEFSYYKKDYALAKKQAKDLINKLNKNSSLYFKTQDIITRSNLILQKRRENIR
jgi:predicted Zn-dependent protease